MRRRNLAPARFIICLPGATVAAATSQPPDTLTANLDDKSARPSKSLDRIAAMQRAYQFAIFHLVNLVDLHVNYVSAQTFTCSPPEFTACARGRPVCACVSRAPVAFRVATKRLAAPPLAIASAASLLLLVRKATNSVTAAAQDFQVDECFVMFALTYIVRYSFRGGKARLFFNAQDAYQSGFGPRVRHLLRLTFRFRWRSPSCRHARELIIT